MRRKTGLAACLTRASPGGPGKMGGGFYHLHTASDHYCLTTYNSRRGHGATAAED